MACWNAPWRLSDPCAVSSPGGPPWSRSCRPRRGTAARATPEAGSWCTARMPEPPRGLDVGQDVVDEAHRARRAEAPAPRAPARSRRAPASSHRRRTSRTSARRRRRSRTLAQVVLAVVLLVGREHAGDPRSAATSRDEANGRPRRASTCSHRLEQVVDGRRDLGPGDEQRRSRTSRKGASPRRAGISAAKSARRNRRRPSVEPADAHSCRGCWRTPSASQSRTRDGPRTGRAAGAIRSPDGHGRVRLGRRCHSFGSCLVLAAPPLGSGLASTPASLRCSGVMGAGAAVSGS